MSTKRPYTVRADELTSFLPVSIAFMSHHLGNYATWDAAVAAAKAHIRDTLKRVRERNYSIRLLMVGVAKRGMQDKTTMFFRPNKEWTEIETVVPVVRVEDGVNHHSQKIIHREALWNESDTSPTTSLTSSGVSSAASAAATPSSGMTGPSAAGVVPTTKSESKEASDVAVKLHKEIKTPTPELDKMAAQKDKLGTQFIGEFLEWLRSKGILLATWETRKYLAGWRHEEHCEEEVSGYTTVEDIRIDQRRKGRFLDAAFTDAADYAPTCCAVEEDWKESDATENHVLTPVSKSIEAILADYAGVDLQKAEQERTRLLEEFRQRG